MKLMHLIVLASMLPEKLPESKPHADDGAIRLKSGSAEPFYESVVICENRADPKIEHRDGKTWLQCDARKP